MNRKGIAVDEIPKIVVGVVILAVVLFAIGIMSGFGPKGLGNKLDVILPSFNDGVVEVDGNIAFRYDTLSGEVKYLDADWRDFPKDNGIVKAEGFEFTEEQTRKDFIAYYSASREHKEIVLTPSSRIVILDSPSAATFEDELKVIFHTFQRGVSTQPQLKNTQNPLVKGFYGAAFPGKEGIYSSKRWEMIVDYNGKIYIDKNPIGWLGKHEYVLIERQVAGEYDRLPQEDHDLIVKTAEEFRNSVLKNKISITGAGKYDVDLIDNFLVVRINE